MAPRTSWRALSVPAKSKTRRGDIDAGQLRVVPTELAQQSLLELQHPHRPKSDQPGPASG
nr:hypothetical protein GCM10017611_51550 [Rhodococcus wratislaviensis]